MNIAPSFFALFFTGIISLFIVIIFIFNFYKICKLKYYPKIILLSIISLVLGIHGLIHLGLESVYGFNPFNI